MKKSNPENNKGFWTALLILCVIGAVSGAAWFFYYGISSRNAERKVEELRDSFIEQIPSESQESMEISQAEESTRETDPTLSEEASQEPEPAENVADLEGYEVERRLIDFDGLWEECADVYAWLYVPGTDIDYPVVQHPTDDNYYLRRSLDGSNSTAGTLFSQHSYNSTDLSDHNTVIYGHNMRNGSMFASLHNFEDPDVFEEYRYFYIYTPGWVKVYEIFAAYVYTDIHLLAEYDTSTEEGFGEYLKEVFDLKGRERAQFHEEVEVEAYNRIVTLSTCVYRESDRRYLVQGKLVAEGSIGNE